MLAGTAQAQDPVRTDQLVRTVVDNNLFMGTVLVARGDQIVFSKAYGQANVERQVANTPQTRFRIASVSKQFTAAAILLLEERGKLTLDDPIKKHYPRAPAAWDTITLRHLLTHTSGIVDYLALANYSELKRKQRTPLETIALVRDKPLGFTPGEKMSYSNSGYVLLGHVIEKVSGVSYGEFLQANIFTPLGMKDSGYDESSSAIIERRATGYERKGETWVNAEPVDMTTAHGDGDLYSTTEDLLRWQRGLYGGRLLSAASLQKMVTPFKNSYALGVMVWSTPRTTYAHGGRVDGFTSQLTYFPDDQISLIVLSNVMTQAPGYITERLAILAHGGTVTLPQERIAISVPREVLQRYVGTYALMPNVDLVVTLEGDQLIAHASGQRFPLFAESRTRFFLRTLDTQLDFVTEEGRVTHVILHDLPRQTKAPKKG